MANDVRNIAIDEIPVSRVSIPGSIAEYRVNRER